MNTTKPINQLVSEFIADQDIRENSRNNYRVTLNIFINWVVVNRVSPSAITKSHILQYKQHLMQARKSIRTIDSYLTSVRRFFVYLEEKKLIDHNPALGIRSPRRYGTFIKGYLNSDQLVTLLEKPNTDTISGKRDYAILSLMVHTGVRVVEVTRLTIPDMYTDGNAHYVKLLRKGRDEKEDISIPGVVYDAIVEYLSTFEDIDMMPAMFINLDGKKYHALTTIMVSGIVSGYLRQCGYKTDKVTAHSLRHSAAIMALRKGVSIYDVMTMLGHTSLKTTQLYLKAIEAESSKNNAAVRAIADELSTVKKNGKYGRNSTPPQAPLL